MSGKPEDRARVPNRAARERSLIVAAGKLFASRGYEATTTREIAAAAGCAEGLISRYFNGKAGLLRALIQLHFDEEAEEFRDGSPPAQNIAEELKRSIAWDVDHMSDDRDFLRVVIPQLLLNPDLGREVREVGPGRHEKMISERLANHREYRSLPEEEQQAIAQLINVIGLSYGFWIPAMGEDPAQARRKAMIIAKIFGKAF